MKTITLAKARRLALEQQKNMDRQRDDYRGAQAERDCRTCSGGEEIGVNVCGTCEHWLKRRERQRYERDTNI